MFKSLRTILTGKTDEKQISITFVRDVSACGRAYSSGETADFPESVALQLIGHGAGYDANAADAESRIQAELTSLLPAPRTPEPLPESWVSMPDCFAQYWDIYQRGIVVIGRRDDIEDELIKRLRESGASFDASDLEKIPNFAQRAQAYATSLKFNIGQPSEKMLREERYLRDALTRAAQAAEEFHRSNDEQKLRLKIACGDYLLETHGALCKTIRETQAAAYSIFETRIAALGLHESKVRSLFHGSADWNRFAATNPPDLANLKLGWVDERGEARHYVEQPVEVMVGLVTGFRAQTEAFSKLLKQAKADLSKAQSIAA